MAMAEMSASEKSFNLQLQMKRNTEEMSSFLKDMSEWTNEVSKKDAQLKTTDKPESVLPPIRSVPKPRRKKKKQVTLSDDKDDGVSLADDKNGGVSLADDKKGGKIHGYDYRAWEKFDVDAAIKEIEGGAGEEEEEVVSSEEEGSTDDEEYLRLEEERRQKQAVYHKEKGNEFFKEGRWEDAVECYTKGLQQDSLNAVLFANRAMALLKLQKYAAALADCDCSIELDDTYTKAYLRRATAHLKLANKQKALEDFKRVLEFEPENKLALHTVRKLEVELEPVKEYIPRKPGDITNMKRTLPPSDKPMLRIQIFDLNSSTEAAKIQELQSKCEVTESSNVHFARSTSDVKAPPKLVKFENFPIRVPANYIQFQTDTRRLKDHPDKLFEYIKQIDPDLYPKLFQNSLEADTLFMILDILHKYYIPNNLPVYGELYYLTKVKRFDMAVMFTNTRQQLIISELVQYVANTLNDKMGVIGLIKAYNILDLSKYKLDKIVDDKNL